MAEAGGNYLTRQDLEAVIRRATELEAEAGKAPDLSEADVLRIAAEVGLSEANIRRALAEYRAGSSSGGLLAERGWASRLCGPALVTSCRTVERPADEVRQQIETHFQTSESLRIVRRVKGGSLWEPESGVVASLMRGFDLLGKGYQLAKKGKALELRVVPLSERSSQVSLTIDLGNDRAGWFWLLGVGVGTPFTLAALGIVAASPDIPNVALGLSPAFLAATIGLARSGYRRSMEKLRLVLDGLLDRVEHDEPLAPPRPSWRDLLK
ncbi:MAG: hypothetical protein PVI01_00425 [Gemmatimonadales bacterium]